MGFSISWLACPSRHEAELLSHLGLTPTGEAGEMPDWPRVIAATEKSWSVLWRDRYQSAKSAEAMLRELSQFADIIFCSVEEHVMASESSYWSAGREKWALSHDGSTDVLGLVVRGDLPDHYASIRTEMESAQAAAGGRKAGVDFIFEIPLRVAGQIAGFKHDEDLGPIKEPGFRELVKAGAPKAPPASQKPPGFFSRLFGRVRRGGDAWI